MFFARILFFLKRISRLLPLIRHCYFCFNPADTLSSKILLFFLKTIPGHFSGKYIHGLIFQTPNPRGFRKKWTLFPELTFWKIFQILIVSGSYIYGLIFQKTASGTYLKTWTIFPDPTFGKIFQMVIISGSYIHGLIFQKTFRTFLKRVDSFSIDWKKNPNSNK